MVTLKYTTLIQWVFLVGTDVWMFEWYVGWCGSKNGNCKDLCVNRIGLCAQNNNYSRFNNQDIWEELYDHLTSMRIFDLTMTKIFIWAMKTMIWVATLGLDLLNISYKSCDTHPHIFNNLMW